MLNDLVERVALTNAKTWTRIIDIASSRGITSCEAAGMLLSAGVKSYDAMKAKQKRKVIV